MIRPASDPESVIVLKFGGSVLTAPGRLHRAVSDIYRELRGGRRVVAVVSAMYGVTDGLFEAGRVAGAGSPDDRALARLVATGETQAVALVGLAVRAAGLPCEMMDVHSAGLRGSGDWLDATPEGADADAMRAALERAPVVIVPGYATRTADDRVAVLGRGGTDLTALVVGRELGATVRLVKDVDGVYERDPQAELEPGESPPRRLARASYDDALKYAGGGLQAKATEYARDHGLTVEFGMVLDGIGTVVDGGPTEFVDGPVHAARPPIRVGLLGLGTVGRGVFDRLADQPEAFEIVGAAVRSPAKHIGSGVPEELLVADHTALLERDPEIVIEVMGGTGVAVDAMLAALSAGKRLITANKAAIASRWADLDGARDTGGGTLACGAAVGGVMPAIENAAVARELDQVVSLRGLVNGTTNFVLGRLAEGDSYDAAVKAAQEAGFAEADPTMDVDGTDAAQKLSILARTLGVSLAWEDVARESLSAEAETRARDAVSSGRALRHVASVAVDGGSASARVALEEVAADSALGHARGADNVLEIGFASGNTATVRGQGAGRWPTAEAVLADVYEAARGLRGG